MELEKDGCGSIMLTVHELLMLAVTTDHCMQLLQERLTAIGHPGRGKSRKPWSITFSLYNNNTYRIVRIITS